MKQTINVYDFERAFELADRKDNFSYAGLHALFEYLEQYEEDCDTEIELDVIALCCEFCEYETLEDFVREHNLNIDACPNCCHGMGVETMAENDFVCPFCGEDLKDAIKEEINNKTLLIPIDDESFIIQCY